MISTRLLAVFLVISLLSSYSVANDGYTVAGNAYNPKSGKLVYRELIGALTENNEVNVSYAKPDGTIFARKTLNYSSEVFQPGFELIDDRDDETVSAIFDGGRLLLTHRVKGDSHTKTLYETLKLVIDAGADAFIQQEWDKITTGRKVEFDVADARHLGIERFIIKEVDASESPLSYKDAGGTWKYFRVDTANKLSSLFTEPMFYAYDPDGKYLMRYQGRANIDDDDGELWDVRVEYEYVR